MSRVLYVCPNAKLAGAEAVTLSLIDGHLSLAKRWEPEIYFLEHGPLIDELRRKGVPVHFRRQKSRARLRNPVSVALEIGEISKVARRSRVDLIHSVMGYGHLFGGPAAIRSGIPEVWFQHGPVGGAIDRIASLIPADAILVGSEHTRAEQEKLRTTRGRIAVIRLAAAALDPDRWNEEAQAWRARIGSSKTIVGLVARIAPLKGHTLLVDAAKIALKENPELSFLIIGDAFLESDLAYKTELETRIRKEGLQKSFLLAGNQNPPYGAMAACDLVVSASLTPEGFGLTLVEAMNLAKPVIAPSAGGPSEIVTSETGLLYEPGNATALAAAISKLARDPALRARMGANGRARALEQYNARRMTEDVEAEYDRVLKQRANRARR